MARSNPRARDTARVTRAMQEPTVRRTWRARAALALSALSALGACASPAGAPTSAQLAPSAPADVPVDTRAADDPADDVAGTPTTAAAPAAEARPDGPKPWTDAFGQKAVIVAEHVRIEGPDGLLDHIAVSADDAFYERTVSHEGTTLTQVTLRLGDEVPIIRGQLDQWQIAAFRRITVIEHLEPCDVTVVATGDASLRDPLGKEERGETLRWVGTIPR